MAFQPIKVTVIHDDYLCRTGLLTAIAACSDMSVHATGSDDLELFSSDVAVTDFDNGMRILMAAQTWQMNRPRVRVAVVATADREWQIREAFERGAAAFVLLGVSADELFTAVRTANGGGCHISPTIATKLAMSLATEPMTARERQVLTLLTDGLCNKQIATQLDISVGTVKIHLRSAFDKLGVHSRTEAILMTERRGILRQPHLPRFAAAGPQTPPLALRSRSQIYARAPIVKADAACAVSVN